MKEIIENTYQERIVICNSCDEDSENKKKTGWTTLRIDRHCTNCGCTTEAKLRCLSCECPIKKWTKLIEQEHEYKLKTNGAN